MYIFCGMLLEDEYIERLPQIKSLPSGHKNLQIVYLIYSLTSPYGHLSITGSSLGPRNTKNRKLPTSINGHLCKADTWFCPFGVRIKEV